MDINKMREQALLLKRKRVAYAHGVRVTDQAAHSPRPAPPPVQMLQINPPTAAELRRRRAERILRQRRQLQERKMTTQGLDKKDEQAGRQRRGCGGCRRRRG